MGTGLGDGVGDTVAVGIGVSVGVGSGVAVDVSVLVGTGVAVAVGSGTAVAVGVGVNVAAWKVFTLGSAVGVGLEILSVGGILFVTSTGLSASLISGSLEQATDTMSSSVASTVTKHTRILTSRGLMVRIIPPSPESKPTSIVHAAIYSMILTIVRGSCCSILQWPVNDRCLV